jgi:hypothetical protein
MKKLYTKEKGLIAEMTEEYYKLLWSTKASLINKFGKERIIDEETYKKFKEEEEVVEKLEIDYSNTSAIHVDVSWQPRYNGVYVIISTRNKKGKVTKNTIEIDIAENDNFLFDIISESLGEIGPTLRYIIKYLDQDLIKQHKIKIVDELNANVIDDLGYEFSVYEGSDS